MMIAWLSVLFHLVSVYCKLLGIADYAFSSLFSDVLTGNERVVGYINLGASVVNILGNVRTSKRMAVL